MDDHTSRLVAKLREALEFFNDHPNFSLRFDRARTSYKIAAEIDKLLKDVGGDVPPAAPDLPSDKALQVRASDATSYTPLQMEAALCAWEWALENTKHAVFLNDDETLFESVGTGAMRHCSIQAGQIALQVYDRMEAKGVEFIGAYDWEFVPEVMVRLDWLKLCDDNQYHREPYYPDIDALLAAILTADKARTTEPADRMFQRKRVA
jgi:hypothetical protein